MSASQPRGMALLLVLILSAILMPFALEFSMQVHLETRTAINVTDQLKIDNEIDGQYEIMLARLRYDATANEVDSYDDEWNSDELRNRSSDTTGVSLTTFVFDEQGKFNIRALADAPAERKGLLRDRLKRLLMLYRRDTAFEVSSGDAESWAKNISEYVNKGAVRANIPTPKMADGRSILILDELNFLEKVGDKRFPFIVGDQREDDNTGPGLHRFVTIYGDGRINLNTADEALLKALFHRNPEIAERIIERRESPPEDGESTTSSDDTAGNPFTEVAQISTVEGVTPQLLQENQVDPNLDFCVDSSFFSFRIVGETQTTRRDELFVVERVAGDKPEEGIEGFRLLLRQERTDPIEQESED
jgi:type II secretory pathway component PulK